MRMRYATGKKLENYRLPGTYVVCHSGALSHVCRRYGPRKGGAGGLCCCHIGRWAVGSVFNLLQSKSLNHRGEVSGGVVLAEESAVLLQEFFKRRR